MRWLLLFLPIQVIASPAISLGWTWQREFLPLLGASWTNEKIGISFYWSPPKTDTWYYERYLQRERGGTGQPASRINKSSWRFQITGRDLIPNNSDVGISLSIGASLNGIQRARADGSHYVGNSLFFLLTPEFEGRRAWIRLGPGIEFGKETNLFANMCVGIKIKKSRW